MPRETARTKADRILIEGRIVVTDVGTSNVGKSAAAGVASELVRAPFGLDIADGAPLGSGEGLAELLMGTRDEENPTTGKTEKVRAQIRHNAYIIVDEGQTVAELGQRSGSTLAPTLRTIFSHGTIGNANASAERRRIIEGDKYVFGILIAIQPDRAGPILDDGGGGTPQRFTWATGNAPRPPDAIHPGPLDWTPPDAATLLADHPGTDRGGFRRSVFDVDGAIVAQVREDHLAALEGKSDIAPHYNLRRLKVAAALALLTTRRPIIDVGIWQLAGAVMTASTEVLESTLAHLAYTASMMREASDRAHISRAVRTVAATADTAEQRALISATRSAAKVVHRHSEAAKHPGSGCVRRCVTLAVAGRDRSFVSTDDVISAAVDAGWIVDRGEHFLPGDSRPT